MNQNSETSNSTPGCNPATLKWLLMASEQSSRGLFIANQDGVIEYHNQALLTLCGLKDRELIGAKAGRLWLTVVRGPSYDTATRQLGDGQTWTDELLVESADNGNPSWIRFSLSSFVDDSHGRQRYFVGLFEDTGRRKHNPNDPECLVVEASSFNQAILNNSPLPMLVYTTDRPELTAQTGARNTVLTINPAFTRTFGHGQADTPTLEAWWSKAFPDPGYRQWVANEWSKRMQASPPGTAFEPLEVEIQCRDGGIRAVQVQATCLAGDGGYTILTTLVDVSALRSATSRFRTLLDTASDGIHILDEAGNVVEFSQSFARMLGYSAAETARLNVGDWEAMIPRDHLIETIQALIRQPATFETRHRRKDGSIFDAEINAKGIILDGRPHLYASTRDISGRHAREAEIAELKERYQRLFDNSPDAYLIIEANGGRIIDCNHAAELMLRGTRDRILGMTPGQLSPPVQPNGQSSKDAAAERIAESLSQGGHRFEWLHRRLDGDNFWAEVAISVIVHDRGPMLFVSWRDIDDRKAMEVALEESRQRLFDIIDFLPDATFVVDADKTVIAWNKAMEEMSGVRAADIIGRGDYLYSLPFYGERRKQLLDLLDIDDAELASQYLDLSRKGATLYAETFVPKLCGGNGAYVWATAAPLFNASGKRVGAIEAIRDITERKRMEDQAKRFEAIVQSSDDAIISKSLDGLVTSWNPGAEKIFGYSADEMLGHPLTAIFPSDRLQEENYILEQIQHGKVVDHFQTVRICKDGRVIDISATISPIRDHLGNIVGVSKIARDITEFKLAEITLAKAKADAESANQAKSAFLASMSHEIRTPLNAIIGTTYLLGLSDLDSAQRRDVNIIDVSSRNLLALINDILDFSKIEAGELTLERQNFLLPELLDDLGTLFSAIAASKGLTLNMPKLADDMPRALVSDVNHLRQMLVNLLNNAIKFTETGGVSLAIERVAHDTDNRQLRLRFTVTDTGIGIAPEARAKLFLPFSQVDSSTGRQYGGTGLGLSIVKRLAELMNGSVGMDSQAGLGSSFWLELPFAVADELPKARVRRAITRPLQVLIAEDSDSDRRLLVKMCENFGWEVEAVDNGEAMIERVASRMARQQPVDCILLDWRMPKLDGLEALSELNRRVGAARMPSVIMVTAYDKDSLLRALSDTQPTGILTKPVNPSMLFNHVNEAVVANGFELSHVVDGTIVDDSHGKWLDGARVMVVDDSRVNLDVTQRILAREGAVSILCESGEQALAALDEHAEGLDLVLMDLQMPGMDGCETTMRIRQRFETGKLPIIALTAGATTTEQQRAFASGLTDFLAKPIEPLKLVRMLRHHIERARGRPLPLAPVIAPIPLESPPAGSGSVAETWPLLDGIDREEASAIVGGDFQFYKQLLALFLTENQDTIKRIRSLLDSGQTDQAARLAHKLRGQAANIGAVSLRDAARAVEETINAELPDLDRDFGQLAAEHEKLFHVSNAWLELQ